MPSPPETIDGRFDELVAQLRAVPPRAPQRLREQLRESAAANLQPPRRPRFAFLTPWLSLPAAGLVLLLVGVAAVVSSLDGDDEQTAVGGRGQAVALERARSEPQSALSAQRAESAASDAAVPAPAARRLQDYAVSLGVRVESVAELSRATSQAMRSTRSLGGYVVTARFDAATGDGGDSFLVVRVPVKRVQDAITRFSALGEIVSQSVQIDDVQAEVNSQQGRIRELQVLIAQLSDELRGQDLTLDERLRLQERRAAARTELRRLRQARDATVARANLARVALTLTTRDPAAQEDDGSSGFGATIRDALSVLGTVLTWTAAAAIVAAPFVALAALAAFGVRRARRRADERLLEQP